MHEHDPDLIMALADGDLPPANRADAEAAVAACPECSLDLEMQRAAVAMLRSVPGVGLSELESTRMHRAIRSGLGIETEITSPNRAINWSRWLAVGAAAAVLIGVVAAAPNLDLIGGGSTGDTAALEQFATTSASGDARVTDQAEPPSATTSDTQQTNAALAPPAAYSEDELPKAFQEMLSDTAGGGSTEGATSEFEDASSSCAESGRASLGEDAQIVAEQRATLDGVPAELVRYSMPDGDMLVAYDPATCKVIDTYSPSD
jgi:Putative zinc-finger